MIKLLLAALVTIHGLAHLMGFSRAFNLGGDIEMSRPISRACGLVWLSTTIAFVASAVLIVLAKDWWHMGMVAILLSQILIISVWKDAKWGSMVNIAILIAAIINFAEWKFHHVAEGYANSVIAGKKYSNRTVTLNDISSLPPVVQKWLIHSAVVGKPYAKTVRLKQTGLLRTQQDGKWMPVQAHQYFSVGEPAFLWLAKIDAGFLHIAGRDECINGKGRMIIKVASLFPVADASGPETDQGALLRYLAEIQWFPSAALSPYIKWEQISDHAARAVLTYNSLTVSGIFLFSTAGDVSAFEANRYMERKGTYSLEKWYIPVTEYRIFEGVSIPSKGKAIWKLKTGDFNWFEWEIADVDFNPVCVY